MSERETPYSDLSDEEFIEELRSRLPQRSWSLNHLTEVERRGRDITEADAELHEALSEQFASIDETMEQVREHFSATLAPLQESLRETLRSFDFTEQLRETMPNLDRLISPDFAKLPERLAQQWS